MSEACGEYLGSRDDAHFCPHPLLCAISGAKGWPLVFRVHRDTSPKRSTGSADRSNTANIDSADNALCSRMAAMPLILPLIGMVPSAALGIERHSSLSSFPIAGCGTGLGSDLRIRCLSASTGCGTGGPMRLMVGVASIVSPVPATS